GGPLSDRYRDALEAELSRKLGLIPARVTAPSPFEPAPAPPPFAPAPLEDPSPSRWLRPALAVALSGALAVGVMAFLQQHAARRDPPPAVLLAAAGLAAEAHRLAAAVALPREEAREGCICARADSPLWKD